MAIQYDQPTSGSAINDAMNANTSLSPEIKQAVNQALGIVTGTEENVSPGMPGDQRATMGSTVTLRANLS